MSGLLILTTDYLDKPNPWNNATLPVKLYAKLTRIAITRGAALTSRQQDNKNVAKRFESVPFSNIHENVPNIYD